MEQTSYVYDSRKRVNKTSRYLASPAAFICLAVRLGAVPTVLVFSWHLFWPLNFVLLPSSSSPLCGLPTSCCSSACEFDLARPGLFQRLTLWGWDWVECWLFLFSLRKGHRVTVKLLSGSSKSCISHVGSAESFVFSLNKKRKRKHLQDPHLPRECRAGPLALVGGLVLLLWSPALPSGDWELHP